MQRLPPSAIPAEESLLGACLLSDMAIEDSSRLIGPDDFYNPHHQHIYATILEHYKAGRIDVVTIAASLAADGRDSDEYTIPGLLKLQNATPVISHAAKYAMMIADAKVRRDLIHAASAISDLGFGETATIDAGDAVDKARDLLAGIDLPQQQGPPDRDVDTFLQSVDTEYDWLIDGFLERRDRMLVTAGEGAGKSVLLAQIAVQCAAGIHPWRLVQVPPRNVLMIDLENGERLVTRRLSGLRAKAGQALDPMRLRVLCRPDGIDLTTRPDRRWLIDRVQANAAELLVIGPAYRMYAGVAARGDAGGEDHARTVTKALDEIRNRCNVSLLLETHAPHGNNYGRDLRPFGSTVWMRWPEFGVGLRKEGEDGQSYTLEHWRGPRDVRTWPSMLLKGGQWPWSPVMPTGTFHNPRSAA